MSDYDDVYIPMPVTSMYRKFAMEDAEGILSIMHNRGYKDLTFDKVQITSKKNTDTGEIVTNVIIPFYTKDKSMEDNFPIEYVEEPEDGGIYAEVTIEEYADILQDRLENPGVYASTSIRSGKRITAAEGDSEIDNNFDESTPGEVVVDDTDTFSDTVDDMQDTLDDMQDTLDDELYDEDEDGLDIEMDNNISGHYIAECDRCKGVFISAVLESDQEIDKISGICPLCDKDTEQHLKWVIKDIDTKEEI